MRLLVVAQTLDKNDPILGFFHAWVASMASQVDSLLVVGLSVGEYDLPKNVTVYSLGKEQGAVSSLTYSWRLWCLIWQQRQQYDVVFAHMNPEYVLAGGLLWRLLRKPIVLWYAHGTISWRLHVATWLSSKILTSTEQGYRLKNAKRVVIGQGIDTDQFSPKAHSNHNDLWRLIIVGRITPSKYIETLISAVALLKTRGLSCQLSVVGPALTTAEADYQTRLVAHVTELGLDTEVSFPGSVRNHELLPTLHAHDIFISDGSTGSLDKVLLEAMAAGLMVISSNESFVALAPNPEQTTFRPHDAQDLADRIIGYTKRSSEEQLRIRQALRAEVVEHHSLSVFTKRIITTCRELV